MPHDSDPTSDQPAKPPLLDAATASHASPAARSAEGEAALPKGSVFGHYTIEDVLGAGGMGVVYRARQERPAREVALKVIRPGFASSQALRRFELEAEVLGRLQHPGIAQVYEAGTGPGSQPFFAMELVRGEALTSYAESRGLGTRARLELFAKVCDAVQHAHTKGIIHRDLKPGNILVDASGQPKILDFGVARLTGHDVQAVTIQTDIGQLIGTVPYMSPEQVEGDPGNLDTRSDVYALGVILFELLTGRLPYDLSKKLIHEAARIIKEDEPTRLSSINRTLRGDVETITLKALEKDKGRRYQAASDLGSDITRFLRDEPIVARPASRSYQLRKFAKRNKVLVGGVLAAFLLLALGLAGTSWGMVRAEEQRRRAVHEGARAEAEAAEAKRQSGIARAVNEFLNRDLLGVASTDTARDPDMPLRTLLRRAAERMGGLSAPPEVEGELRLTIGRAYSQLSLDDEAELHLTRALKLLEATDGPRSLPVAEALHHLAYLRSGTPDGSDRRAQIRRSLEIRQALLPPDDPLIALTISDLHWINGWERKWDTLDLYPDALVAMVAGIRGKGESAAELRARMRELIAEIERDVARGDQARAEKRVEEEVAPFLALAPIRQRVPLSLAQVAVDYAGRGLRGVGRAAGAVASRLAIDRMAIDDPIRAFTLAMSTQALARSGATEEARAGLGAALETVGRCLEAEQGIAVECWSGLGRTARLLKEAGQAEWLFSWALAESQRTSLLIRETREAMRGLAGVYTDEGERDAAIEWTDRLVRMNDATPRCPPGEVVRDLVTLGRMRLEAGDPAGAAGEIECALSDNPRRKASSPITLREGRYVLARAALDLGDPIEAERINCNLLAEVRRDDVAMDLYVARYVALAARLARLGARSEEARRWALEGLEAARLAIGPDHARTLDLGEELARSLADLGRFPEGAALLESQRRAASENASRVASSRRALQALVDLYTAWHAAEPGKGYDLAAAAWKAKLDALPAEQRPPAGN